MNKKSGIVFGIVLIIIGLILAIIGLTSFFSAPGNINQENSNPIGAFASVGIGIVIIFIGAILIGAGILIIYLTNIEKIFSYIATETAPGVETSSHALGKGLARGVKAGLKNKSKKKKKK
ncbi:MAG: hypothetical protein KKF48_01045 [Nanoarchaeota archaeon]|nr:hypothetical protein [Nanoarchaeota archaeon]MBU1027609.1 hypothetical protein [Nanoarchaeota archaeon]